MNSIWIFIFTLFWLSCAVINFKAFWFGLGVIFMKGNKTKIKIHGNLEQNYYETFPDFTWVSLRNKWNRTRLSSPEAVCKSHRTSSYLKFQGNRGKTFDYKYVLNRPPDLKNSNVALENCKEENFSLLFHK